MIGTGSRKQLLILGWLVASAMLTIVLMRLGDSWLADSTYLLIGGGAALAAWIGALLLPQPYRLFGVLIAVGITLTTLGDLTSYAAFWRTGMTPEASLADIGWLGVYVMFGAALLLLLRRGGRDDRRDVDGLIDVAAVTVAGLIVVWELAVEATLADPSLSIGIRLLWGLYPVLDLAVLALAVRLLLRDRTVTGLLITIGLTLWLAGDVGYLAIANAEQYSALLDAAWVWGAILIALGVLRGPQARLRLRERAPKPVRDQIGVGRILMALLPLLVPALVELQWYLRGVEVNPTVTLVGLLVLVALAFARMVRLASAARAARRALASQERYAAALAANSADAVVVLDADLRFVSDFPRLAALLGDPGHKLRGRVLLELVVPEDTEGAQAAVERCLASPGQVFYVEFRAVHVRGRPVWLAARVVNLLADPDVHGIVVNLHDVSDRKGAEEELNHQAFHDALTGLANRALFRDRLKHALENRGRTGYGPAVIFLDLDGFKAVNDSLGHDAGDELLKGVAAKLTEVVRRGDTVARAGGDEFAILIEQSDLPMDEAATTADRVLAALREPVRLADRTVTITASLGIAVADRTSESAGLLRDADVAMYRSKSTGKDRWTSYLPGMRTAAMERVELETDLHTALADNQLRLYFQPLVELQTDQVMGLEALVRWEHPEYGLLPPQRFVPVAEETGLIVPIERWVLQEAARTAARWQERFWAGRTLSMAVNISARHLAAADFVGDVTDALTDSGLDPVSLILEMTETALVHDTATVAIRLHRLHWLGVQLAVDDFGTGYSSLSHLRHFPVDIVKIDHSFIDAIPERGEFPALVRGLLEFGRTMQVKTVAEGVETDFQRTRLRDEQCDLAQGFLFAQPMSVEETEQYLTNQRVTSPH